MQLVTAAASAPAQDQEAQQASAQELQALKESLNQSENRTRELEGHLENLNRVSSLPSLKGTYYAPLYKMYYKSQVSPECVCEVSAQNTPQIIYYIILKMPIFSGSRNGLF